MIHVLEKDGVSYFKLDSYSATSCVVNGKKLTEKCKGDPSYFQINDKVISIQEEFLPPTILQGFKLKDQFLVLNQSDPNKYKLYFKTEEKPDWDWESEDTDFNFYEKDYFRPPSQLKDREFIIIDKNCEPVVMIPGVSVDFPNNLSQHQELWHKFPCRISSDAVFSFVRDKALLFVKSSPARYKVTDLENIKCFKIEEYIEVNFLATEIVSYYPSLRAKKMVKKEVAKKNTLIELLDIQSQSYSGARNPCPSFSAENYEQLLIKLNKYCDDVLSVFTSKRRCVCEECKGLGIVEK